MRTRVVIVHHRHGLLTSWVAACWSLCWWALLWCLWLMWVAAVASWWALRSASMMALAWWSARQSAPALAQQSKPEAVPGPATMPEGWAAQWAQRPSWTVRPPKKK